MNLLAFMERVDKISGIKEELSAAVTSIYPEGEMTAGCNLKAFTEIVNEMEPSDVVFGTLSSYSKALIARQRAVCDGRKQKTMSEMMMNT